MFKAKIEKILLIGVVLTLWFSDKFIVGKILDYFIDIVISFGILIIGAFSIRLKNI